MALRDTPPFRADHVGSLLRPPELLQARADFAAGAITAEDLRAAEDEAIRSVVRLQEEPAVEQLCLSPQCGFSSTVEGNVLSHDQQVAKLRLIAETAEEIWG